jgi:hypothetical protein
MAYQRRGVGKNQRSTVLKGGEEEEGPKDEWASRSAWWMFGDAATATRKREPALVVFRPQCPRQPRPGGEIGGDDGGSGLDPDRLDGGWEQSGPATSNERVTCGEMGLRPVRQNKADPNTQLQV